MGPFYQHLTFVLLESSLSLHVFREKLHWCRIIMCFRTVSIILFHSHHLLSSVVLFRVSPATPLWIPALQTPRLSKAKHKLCLHTTFTWLLWMCLQLYLYRRDLIKFACVFQCVVWLFCVGGSLCLSTRLVSSVHAACRTFR
jgi:hypothetical protein